MILHEDLSGFSNRAEVFPLFGSCLTGARATVLTPGGGQRSHVIVEASSFPKVMVQVRDGGSSSGFKHFFLDYGKHDELEWHFETAEAERRLLDFLEIERNALYLRRAAEREEETRRQEEMLRQAAELEVVRVAAARGASLESLRLAHNSGARRFKSERLLRDLYAVRDLIGSRRDLDFVGDLEERRRRGQWIWFSAGREAWLMDIVKRVVRSIED